MIVGTGVVELHLPDARSLKAKRSILKSIIARLHGEFNISCGEIDHHDLWQSAVLGVAVVSTRSDHAHQVIENAVRWIETNRPDVIVISHSVEIIS